MSDFFGQVIVTEKLLNQVVKPLILAYWPVISAIDFSLSRGIITFDARGRYFIQFRAAGTVRLISFNFRPGSHNLTLAVEVKVYPRLLNLFLRNPLEIFLAAQPGMRIKDDLIQIDLEKIPAVAAFGKLSPGGTELFSLLEVTVAGSNETGLLFDLHLVGPKAVPQQGRADT